MPASVDAVVEKTYQDLLSVVQTTAVSKRVLQRPPFTFLHKLLVETLEQYGIFTPQQLEFCKLTTKEDKAAFLTRALAFVSYAMNNLKQKTLSVLLLVSPVKMLAGVSVEDTLEFLAQLCVVCKSSDTEAKESAAREVLAKGDTQLYTAGVTFRKGLVLIQAIIRAFISRRVAKRKLGGSMMDTPMGMSKAEQFQHGLYTPGAVQSREVGTKFLKELANGRVYDGVIVAVHCKRYSLRYDQDPEAEDNVDEIEMKILLEESVRLLKLRERMHKSEGAPQQDDPDLSLTSLPNLLPPVDVSSGRQKIPKRYSSTLDIDRLVPQATTSGRPKITRSMSTRQPAESLPSPDVTQVPRSRSSFSHSKLESIQNQMIEDEEVSANHSRLGRIQSQEHFDEEREKEPGVLDNGHDVPDTGVQPPAEKPWQESLKQTLAKGQASINDDAFTRVIQPKPRKAPKEKTRDARTPSNNTPTTITPVFPELTIPGKRKLPIVQKRKQPTAGFSSPGGSGKPLPKSKGATGDDLERASSTPSEALRSTPSLPGSNEVTRSGVARLPTMSVDGDVVVDKAFGGAYQSTDQKTQEILALFREIVHRIDGYMKRKRLRVIDLFRFCDADGNGSISPQEMIDTLSQMEIQLLPEQAHEFIEYIDKDGNGSIDIDEFEELLRVARRNEAQREQLKKELSHAKKNGPPVGESGKASGNRFAALIKNRQRILDELKALDIGDVGAVNALQAKSTLVRLQLPGVDETVVNELFERSRALLSTPDTSTSPPPLSSESPSIEQAANADPTVYLQHIVKALNDLEWSKKANRFLDQSWLAQFDSQLERAFRDFELL